MKAFDGKSNWISKRADDIGLPVKRKKNAERLREEMDRRRLRYDLIDWR